MSAAVTAGTGATLAEVIAAAEEARDDPQVLAGGPRPVAGARHAGPRSDTRPRSRAGQATAPGRAGPGPGRARRRRPWRGRRRAWSSRSPRGRGGRRARAEVGRAALAGLHRHRRLGPVRGRLRRRRRGVGQRRPGAERRVERGQRRRVQASTIVLSPSSALPSRTSPSSPASQRRGEGRRRRPGGVARAPCRLPERRPVQRAGRAADGGDQRPAEPHLERVARRSVRRQLGRAPPPVARGSCSRRGRRRRWPGRAWSARPSRRAATASANPRHPGRASAASTGTQTPQRRPGVLTGASHSRVSSSSSLVSVSMQPAISRLVT